MTGLSTMYNAAVPESAVGWPFELSQLELLGISKLA